MIELPLGPSTFDDMRRISSFLFRKRTPILSSTSRLRTNVLAGHRLVALPLTLLTNVIGCLSAALVVEWWRSTIADESDQDNTNFFDELIEWAREMKKLKYASTSKA